MKAYYIFIVLLSVIEVLNGKPPLIDNRVDGISGDQSCQSCRSIVSFVNRVNSNDSKLLETAFAKLCNDYSSLPGQQTTQTCKYMARDVFDLFKNANRNTFCEEISACASSQPLQVNQTPLTATDNPSCDFCVTVVTNLKEIISGGPTELEVKYFVEDACHYLGSFENECVSISDEYIDNLFAFIRQSLQPKVLCKTIGACNTTKVEQIQKIPDISEVINIFPPQMPLVPLKSAEPVEVTDVECDICKRVVQMIEQELKDNRTEQSIISALEKVCSLLPKSYRNQCDTFVEQYANELIHILIEEGDPSLACALLGVCVPKSVWQTIHKSDIEREDTKTISNQWIEIQSPVEVQSSESETVVTDSLKKESALCYECELLMHFIQNEIYDYNNEEQVEEFIEHQLCDKMTIVITKDACSQFIRQYGPQVMQLIAQKIFDPSTVCHKELKICNRTQLVAASQTPQQEFQMTGPSPKCDLCISLVQQIDSLLENEEFDKEVSKIVEKTCTTLPRAKRVECQLMIEAFAPYFLQTIGHMTDANQVCRSIDMCYSSGQLQLLGGHKCSFGPTYWCHTMAHAESCKATHFCKSKVWKPIVN